MNIAFTTRTGEPDAPMDPRFGRTRYLQLLDSAKNAWTVVDNGEAEDVAHGAGPRAVQMLLEHEVDVLVTGNGPGGKAAEALARTGIRVFVGAGEMTLSEANAAYVRGELPEI